MGILIESLPFEIPTTTVIDSALYAYKFSTFQAALTAFAASPKKVLVLEPKDYNEQGITISGLTDKIIDGNGARFGIAAASAVGITLDSAVRTTVRNLWFTGTGAGNGQTGLSVTNADRVTVENVTGRNMHKAVDYVSAVSENYGIVTIPVASFFERISADSCNIGVHVQAEYAQLNSLHITRCAAQGVLINAGNVSLANSKILGNQIGVMVDSSNVVNGDHGILLGNTINHNIGAGVYLKQLDQAMNLTGNEIWATLGNGGTSGNLGTGIKASSFGVYLENCANVNIMGGHISRNKKNLAVDGWIYGTVNGVQFQSDPGYTSNHIIELGAGTGTFGDLPYGALNAFNAVVNCNFGGTLLGGAKSIIFQKESIFAICKGNTGAGLPPYVFLSDATAGNYIIDGTAERYTIASTFAGTLLVASTMLRNQFEVSFISVASGTKTLGFPEGTTVVSNNPGATAGTGNVTLTATGRYLFTAYGDSSIAVS